MTGNIFKLHGDPHHEVLALLPWFVTEQLDAADRMRVEQHLDTCGECRAALEVERRLDHEIGRAPLAVDAGWANLRDRIELSRMGADAPPRRRPAAMNAAPRIGAPVSRWPVSWRIGVPMGVAAALGLAVVTTQAPVNFAALGAAPAMAGGNVVIIFRPETSEAVFRQTLRSTDARLVDGPTASNAYVLAVPPADRSAVIGRLRLQPQVILAEPVDGAPAS